MLGTSSMIITSSLTHDGGMDLKFWNYLHIEVFCPFGGGEVFCVFASFNCIISWFYG